MDGLLHPTLPQHPSGLGTSSYDSGLYDQGIWLLSRFEAPFVTLMGRNLLGDHTSFVLLLLAPLYWVVPGAGSLSAPVAAIGAGAIPVFLYARRRLESEWFAVRVWPGTYLLHPAVGLDEPRELPSGRVFSVCSSASRSTPALEAKWKLYLGCSSCCRFSVKEDVSLVIVPLGIWVGWKRSARYGLVTVLASVAFMAVAMLVVMRSLIGVPTRNGWRIPFGGLAGFGRSCAANRRRLGLIYFWSEGVSVVRW